MDRSGTGSNNPPIPIEVLQPAPSHEDTTTTVMAPISPKKKMAVKKKLTPKKLQIVSASPSTPDSPSSNTRSKKKLNM
jgi:cell division protein FtsN